MTVCGEKVTGVCVAAKCPHFKRCCPVVWDKYGRIKPQTNEEWLWSATTEEKAKEIYKIAKDDFKELRKQFYGVANDDIDAIAMWLKEKHEQKGD